VRGPDCEGEVWTGKLEWLGETRRTIKDAVMAAASNGPETTATSEAADWRVDYLTLQSGSADSALIKAEGRTAGHCEAALHRARKKSEITATSSGFPRKTFRCLPASRFTSSRVTASGKSAMNEMNEMTTANQGSQSFQSLQSLQSFRTPCERETADTNGSEGDHFGISDDVDAPHREQTVTASSCANERVDAPVCRAYRQSTLNLSTNAVIEPFALKVM
jgi:hypothetical protein